MNISVICEELGFEVVCPGKEEHTTGVFCCDLLSLAMGRLPAGAAWATVMANQNTIAVAVLTECAGIILCEGQRLPDAALEKAQEQGAFVAYSDLPVYETAKAVDEKIS